MNLTKANEFRGGIRKPFQNRIGALLLLLPIVAGFAAPLWALSPAPQIAFVQGRDQNQQSLPPEKKKSLSGLGPDEVFREPNEPAPASRKPDPRSTPRAQASATPRGNAAPTPTPTALPKASAAPILTVSQPPPSGPPANTASIPNGPNGPGGSGSSNSSNSPNGWLLPGLGFLTLGVFAALVFVLNRLRQLLREGGNA